MKTTSFRTLALCSASVMILSSVFSGARLQAALIAYEGFDYTGTALVGQNGGTGWTGAWTTTGTSANNTLSNDATSLSYPGTFESPNTAPPTVGAHVKTGGLTGNASNTRVFSPSVSLAVDGNVLYASALVKKNLANGSSANDNVLLEFTDSAGNRRFGLGIEGAGDRPWLNANGSGSPATTVTAGDTYFLVAKIISSASGLDTAYLKVFGTGYNAEVPVAEPATPAAWDFSLTETTGAVLDRIRVRIDSANTAAAPGEVDEIRIGTTWESVIGAPEIVVPEPSSLALVSLACFGVAVRRRRP